MQYKISTGETITAENKYFAKGGEAKIYKIISPVQYINLIIKIYDKPIEDKKFKKIQYLMNNFSFHKATHKQIIDSIILPKYLVYDSNANVIGFIMNMVENKITLREVLLNNLNEDYKKLKLSKDNVNAYSNRLIIMYNLIQVIKEIHRNNIILVDMKPENILINKDGDISFIDFDSIQIYSKEKNIFYPASVHTEEYAPIEKINYKITPVNASWDLFILGVIGYQLFFRIHPYMVMNDEQLTQEEYKQKAMFAHGKFKHNLHLNPAHKDFNNIDLEFQKLFLECLDIGCNKPYTRPSLNKWEKVISRQLKNKTINIHSWDYAIKLNTNLIKRKKPVFKKPKFNYQLIESSYDITISWDIQNIKEASLGYSLLSYKGSYLPINYRKQISIKDSLTVPIISTLFQFIAIDYNNYKHTFNVEFNI